MIHCEDVHKQYTLADRRVQALKGVDLRIDAPGFYGIMGQSGSGKSTLLHLLAALDRPDSGRITVADRRIDSLTEREATGYRRTGIGLVFQQYNLLPTLTARENVELPGMLAGMPAGDLRKRSAALLDELGVTERADHRPEALSGGEQQRIAIARALLHNPPVLLADEPTGNLDSASSDKLWSLLATLASERELTVVMVTHEPAAATHCGLVYVLKDGRVHGTIQTEGLDAAGVATRYQQCVRAA